MKAKVNDLMSSCLINMAHLRLGFSNIFGDSSLRVGEFDMPRVWLLFRTLLD